MIYFFSFITLLSFNEIKSFTISNTVFRQNLLSKQHFKESKILQLYSTTKSKEEEKILNLSDVDTKVLQSLMEENKNDANIQHNVKRLLEKDSQQKQEQAYQQSSSSSSEGEGGGYESKYDFSKTKFASKVFQKLEINSSNENEIWNSFVTKASSVLGTAGIFVLNRVERDLKLVGALGLFAWERALSDTGRVLLPSTSSFNQTQAAAAAASKKFLSSNSSYEKGNSLVLLSQKQQQKQLFLSSSSSTRNFIKEELTTPQDEFRQVFESVKEILSSSTSTIAPKPQQPKPFLKSVMSSKGSFTERNQERFQKSYKRKRAKKQTSATAVLDATYELQKEMEQLPAGYKTKVYRDAFQETIQVQTKNLLDESRKRNETSASTKFLEGFNSFINKNKTVQAKNSFYIEESTQQVLTEEHRQELITAVQSCIDTPSETWLTADILERSNVTPASYYNMRFEEGENTLKAVIMELVTLKNTLEEDEMVLSIDFVTEKINQLCKIAENAIGDAASEELNNILMFDSSITENDINGDYVNGVFYTEPIENISQETLKGMLKDNHNYKSNSVTDPNVIPNLETIEADIVNDVEIVDASFEQSHDTIKNDLHQESSETISSASFVEVIIDDDEQDERLQRLTKNAASSHKYDNRVINEKKVSNEFNDEDNILLSLTLRSFDVLFFVLEKVFTVLIPYTLSTSIRFNKRIQNMQSNGLGEPGWYMLENLQDAQKRY